jgi:hypothetical protein
METLRKKELSGALRKAMTEEHLWSHDTVKLLNINPQYVSMMLNPNSFDKAGSTAWVRIEDWFKTNDTLANYKFPDGEEIWKPKEKAESKDFNIQSPKKEKLNGKKVATAPGKGTKLESENDTLMEAFKKGDISDLIYIRQLEEERNTLLKKNSELINSVNVLESYNTDLNSANKELANKIKINSRELKVESCEQTNETIRIKVALDIEINLVVNGQRVCLN